MRPVPQARGQHPYRPPIVSVVLALLGWLASYQFYSWGKAGSEWFNAACLGSGGMALLQMNRAVVDYWRQQAHQVKVAKHHAQAKEHGQGRWATWKDIDGHRLFSEEKGYLLGTWTDGQGITHDVRLTNRERRNVMWNAPAGTGKTTKGFISPIFAGLGESFLVTDYTLEILQITYDWLVANNWEVVLLTPFIDEAREFTGKPWLQDIGIDLFSSIRLGMPLRKLRSELQSIAERVIPDIARMTQEEKFFFEMARKLFRYAAWKDLSRGRKPTLASIWAQLQRGPGDLMNVFADDQDDPSFEGLIADMAEGYGGILRSAGEQFAGGYEVLAHHLEGADRRTEFGAHVSHATFDVRRLKNPKEKIALFIHYPLQHLEAHKTHVSMTITHIADVLAADHQTGCCTWLLDECGAIPLLSLARNLNLYRKTGQRYVAAFQDVMGQTTTNFGERAMLQQLLNGFQIKLAANMQEHQSLMLFSDLCGTRGIDSFSLSDRAGMGDSMPDLSPGMGHVSVPFIRPEEIRLLGENKLLMVAEGLQPALLDGVPYFERWADVAGENPYYRGG